MFKCFWKNHGVKIIALIVFAAMFAVCLLILKHGKSAPSIEAAEHVAFIQSAEAETVESTEAESSEYYVIETSEGLSIPVPAHSTPTDRSIEVVATAYCPCEKCCGKTDGITATGTKATAGRTIAVDPSVIPYGSEVIIDGNTYIAEDCGGAVRGNEIDIFFDTHEEALAFGRRKITVKVND